jgi:transcriptional regulator with XRE-family HTH domain
MRTKKISNVELEQLVREGNGVSEIARKLGVSKGAVSKRLKALQVSISKDVALRSAPEIMQNKMDAMAQLSHINQLIQNELDYIEETISKAEGDERKQLQDQKLKHVAEVRKQLGLLLNIAQTFFNAEEIAAFQETVLEEIGNAAPEVQHRIRERLNARRLVGSTLPITG